MKLGKEGQTNLRAKRKNRIIKIKGKQMKYIIEKQQINSLKLKIYSLKK